MDCSYSPWAGVSCLSTLALHCKLDVTVLRRNASKRRPLHTAHEASMNNETIHPLTQNVLKTFAGCTDLRLKQIMTALVKHLHAFANEVELTGEEWRRGIEFLTATGKQCSGIRQEFILLSDTLGLSIM